MIIGLENKMDNIKIEIMNIVSKKINSFKFQQKHVEEQDSLSSFCPKRRKKHLLRECPLYIKGTNKCEICTENHAMEKCPSMLLQIHLSTSTPTYRSVLLGPIKP